MAGLLTRAQIFSAPIPAIEVEIPEWQGSVRVRALSVRQRAELLDLIHANERDIEDYEADQALPPKQRKGLAKVDRYDQTVLTVLFTLVDDRDQRLLTMDDYGAACDLSMPSLRKLWEAFMQLENGDPGLKKSLS